METESSVKYHINLYEIKKKYYKGKELTKLEKELLILTLDDYQEIKKISEGSEELMEVRDKLYDLTNDIDNIGLYDPEKRRKEELELKIEYHTKLALEKGIENGSNNEKKTIAKNLLKDGLPIDKISNYTGLSEKQIMMLN